MVEVLSVGGKVNFKVEMPACGITRGADITDDLTLLYILTGLYSYRAEMCVKALIIVAARLTVSDNHIVTVAAATAFAARIAAALLTVIMWAGGVG